MTRCWSRHPDVKHAAHDLGLFAYVHSNSDFTYMKVLLLKLTKLTDLVRAG